MSLKAGIVGLPNVGKSTLFNAITKKHILAANYPFATIEPNVGVVTVPDTRLDYLVSLYNPKSVVPTTFEFIDIAGLVSGASTGEGLGNKFLAHIRECQAICHVVRAFKNDDILRADQKLVEDIVAQAKEDIEIINLELQLADEETKAKIAAKRKKDPSDENVPYLTEKPVIYMFNVDEAGIQDAGLQEALRNLIIPHEAIFVNAKLEEEMAGMNPAERKEFLESYGVENDALEELVKAAYRTLKLQSFLTAGEKEVRAWTIRQGATAPEAAGTIHTDFERGFIAAAICNYDDLVRLGSEKAVKEAGLLRTEGKTYVMKDGDVAVFRFNV